MGRKRGYIRVWKGGPSADEQREALRVAGVEVDGSAPPVYIDAPSPRQMQRGAVVLTEREKCINDMRQRRDSEDPDELVVCAPWVLAISPGDLFSVAAKLAEKGAVIHDLMTGQRMKWIPEMAGLADMAATIARFQHTRKTEKARIALAASGSKGGSKPKLTGKLLDLFLTDWSDPRSGTNAEVARRHGVSLQTAHRTAGMSRTEAIRRADRVRHDRMEEPVEMKPKRGRRPKPPPTT